MANQPTDQNTELVLFGETTFRNQRTNFGIKMDDRRRHMYIIGKTGMGKTELLKNIAAQDIFAGRGIAFVDPHGDVAEGLLDYIPPHRVNDVIYINPADQDYPIGFNVMESVDPDKRHLVADGIMSVFKKLWVDLWSARMEYILNYTLLALLEVPDSTLLSINRMLAEKDYRKWVVDQVKDTETKAFWTQEFAKYDEKFAREATASIQNKIGQFVSNVLIRNMIGQPKSSFDVRKAMDEQKIILVNISKGRVGEDASRLLGGLLITKIQLAAMSRIDIAQKERKDFVLFVDEFQNFATSSFANILSEARKFNLSLVVAHQYVAQMDEQVRDAVFGNVGTIVSFRVGAEDADLLEKEFSPEFMAQDIVNLGKRELYLKLMIDGVASKAFSARTMDTMRPPEDNQRERVIEASRVAYARQRKEVEDAITTWREPIGGAQPPSGFAKESRPRSNADFQDDRPRSFSPRGNEPREQGPRQAPVPRSAPSYPPRDNQPPRPVPPPPARSSGISLGEVLKREPVDFKGQKVVPRDKPQTHKPKPEIDTLGLHQIIEQTLAKTKKEDE